MKDNFNINEIKIIIGLGNPEKKYQNTYHNVGRLFIQYLEEKPDITPKLITTDCNMNASGQFVRKALDYYNLKPENLVVAHDDSDLSLGQYKLSFNRGSAGHKGIESVIRHLRTKRFWRLRLGIRPEEYKGKAEKFVLKKIPEKQTERLRENFEEITWNYIQS